MSSKSAAADKTLSPAYYATDRQAFMANVQGYGWVVRPRAASTVVYRKTSGVMKGLLHQVVGHVFDEQELERLGRYEPPFGTPAPPDTTDLYALFDTKHFGRTLVNTRLVSNGRVGEYRAHFLNDVPADAPLYTLLAGRRADFWHKIENQNVADTPPLPEWSRWVAEEDEAFRAWLREHRGLFTSFTAAYRLTGHRQLYFAAPPADVFWCVYGVARLLPAAWTADLTFTTFARHPAKSTAKVVGTWWEHRAEFTDTMGRPPNVTFDTLSARDDDDTTGSFNYFSLNGPAEDYILRAISRVRAGSLGTLARFLAGPQAAHLERFDFARLEEASLISLEPESLSAPELLKQLAHGDKDVAQFIFESTPAMKSVSDQLNNDAQSFQTLLRHCPDHEPVLAEWAAEWVANAAADNTTARIDEVFTECMAKLSAAGRDAALAAVYRDCASLTDLPTLRTLVRRIYRAGGMNAVRAYQKAHTSPAAWERLTDEPFPEGELNDELIATVPTSPRLIRSMLANETVRAKVLSRARGTGEFADSLAKHSTSADLTPTEQVEALGTLLRACPVNAPRLLDIAFRAGRFPWLHFGGQFAHHFAEWRVTDNPTFVTAYLNELLMGSKPKGEEWVTLAAALRALERSVDQVTVAASVRWAALGYVEMWVESPAIDANGVQRLTRAIEALTVWAGPDLPFRDQVPATVRRTLESDRLRSPEPDRAADTLRTILHAVSPVLGDRAVVSEAALAFVRLPEQNRETERRFGDWFLQAAARAAESATANDKVALRKLVNQCLSRFSEAGRTAAVAAIGHDRLAAQLS